MGISNRTRKLLWGTAGARCSLCKQGLVRESEVHDSDAIIGEECHIHSGRPQGPRHNPNLPADEVDGLENLILLCRNDHHQVDTQVAEFSAERLRALKESHVRWVQAALDGAIDAAPSIDIEETRLEWIRSGSDLVARLTGISAIVPRYEQWDTNDQAEAAAAVIDTITDWLDLLPNLSPGETIRAGVSMDGLFGELLDSGYFLFAGSEQVDYGGVEWDAASLWFVRISTALEQWVQRMNHDVPGQPDAT